MFTNVTKSTLATVGILSSLVACSPNSQNSAVELKQDKSGIIGGTQVEKSDAIVKTTVGLITMFVDHKGNEGQSLCTATIIAEDALLTAGHCIPSSDEFAQAGIVIAFTTDLNTAGPDAVRYAADVLVHPYYGKTGLLGQDMHDLALIRFEGGLPAGYEVAKLLEDDSLLAKGATVTLAGFGINKTDGVTSENDNTLRKTDVKVIEKFGMTEVILDQSQGKGACHGDSGGPAFLEVNGTQYVWGVTSRGGGQGKVDDCSLFAIYTNIKAQRGFIDAGLEYLEQNKGK